MPIRINLLAEAQAAELQRRRDPVKRVAYGAGFTVFLVALWALTLQLKIMTAGSELSQSELKWKSIEGDYNKVVQQQRMAIEMEQKLAALERLRTNRFLWGTAFNAFQQTLNTVDGIQVTRLRGDQVYGAAEESRPRGTPASTDPRPSSATENISFTIEAIDYGRQPGAQVNKFKEAITTVPYFQEHLQKTNGVRLTSLSAPQVSDSMGGSFVKFTLQCFFPEKVRN